jgi:NAD(P)-dependent dehydrogenase (short-subunit alcohol dehydrogenase family)
VKIVYMEELGEKDSGGPGVLGKRALVMGGTGGIGRELARLLFSLGADIVVHGRSEARIKGCLRAFAAEFPGSPSRASGLAYEFSSGNWIDFPALREDFPAIDILIPAFGPFLQKPLAETLPGDWFHMAALNLALPGALVSAVLPGMLRRGYGRILLLGGTKTDEIRGFSTNPAYAAAKTGLGVLSKSVAMAAAGRDVFCLTVCPGYVDTEYLDEATRERLRARSPGEKLMSPAAFAQDALFLALSGAENGSIRRMDGGL